MKAEGILSLVDSYGAWTSNQTYEPLRNAIAEQAAERRQLAKHCVVIIPVMENGNLRKMVWCTVCQSRLEYLFAVGPNPEKLFHRADCLVGKVEAEG